MSDELKSTQIYYGENVLMMRVDDCLIFGNKDALRRLAEKLTELPSAEPERKKGEWIEQDDGWDGIYYECSECREAFTLMDGTPTDNLYNFCPSCGADMRGE